MPDSIPIHSYFMHTNLCKYIGLSIFNNFRIDMPDVLTGARAAEMRGTAPAKAVTPTSSKIKAPW